MNDQAIEQEIQAKGLTAPRITPDDIEANIDSTRYFTAWEGVHGHSGTDSANLPPEQAGPLHLLTFCVLVLHNGFTVTGESACASPENFDAEIGRKIARQNAVSKLWPLMGYELKQRLHEAANVQMQPALGAAFPGYSGMQPHKQRVVDELTELNDKLTKLEAFADTTLFAVLDEDERKRLMAQHGAMFAYSSILGERIAAF